MGNYQKVLACNSDSIRGKLNVVNLYYTQNVVQAKLLILYCSLAPPPDQALQHGHTDRVPSVRAMPSVATTAKRTLVPRNSPLVRALLY